MLDARVLIQQRLGDSFADNVSDIYMFFEMKEIISPLVVYFLIESIFLCKPTLVLKVLDKIKNRYKRLIRTKVMPKKNFMYAYFIFNTMDERKALIILFSALYNEEPLEKSKLVGLLEFVNSQK